MQKPLVICLFAAGVLLASATADTPPSARRRTPVVEVFERCRDAVVNISTTKTIRIRPSFVDSPLEDFFNFGGPRPQNQRVSSIGSGAVIHETGYIVTNAHVVNQTSDVHVTFADDSKLPADVVAVDAEHDLAVLKVNAKRPLPYVRLGHSRDIMIGETVVAIGNPLGLQHTVTTGIVSALNRELRLNAQVSYTGLIQTDASINPGNSGGPLLNIDSELIGINTAIRGDAQNIGFAIPVDRLWELIPEMLDIERRERVRFGLQVAGPQAEVITVRPDSPAEKAGLKAGDHILRFNEHTLRDGIDYYVHLLAEKPGEKVRLSVQRGERQIAADVPLVSIPPPDGRKLTARLLGLTLAPISDKLRREWDIPRYIGLIVENVEEGGPADRAGVRAGDLILGLDRVSVPSLETVGLTLEALTPGATVVVHGLRVDADPAFRWSVAIKTRGQK